MNKWEDSFKKTSVDTTDVCRCSSNQGLFVPNRQLSFIVAGLLFLAFCIFMTGYFLGKKTVVAQFTENLQQEAFTNQIYASVISVPQENKELVTNTLLVTEANIVELPHQSINQDIPIAQETTTLQESTAARYYAQLIGFGTEKAAQLFVKKLAVKGIETEIKKRVSKTVKGRTSYWYQVVTTTYTNKDDLSELVNKIAKEENIKDASIRVC
jgi:cell division protein FtsN